MIFLFLLGRDYPTDGNGIKEERAAVGSYDNARCAYRRYMHRGPLPVHVYRGKCTKDESIRGGSSVGPCREIYSGPIIYTARRKRERGRERPWRGAN